MWMPLMSNAQGANWERLYCERVYDGDTYGLVMDSSLTNCRLVNVDAPELAQPFGREATDSVAALMEGREVWVQIKARDYYGRPLVRVKVEAQVDTLDTRLLSLDSLMVAKGWAWHYAFYSDNLYLGLLQEEARKSKLGLWRCENYLEPWVYRKLRRRVQLFFEECE